MYERNCCISLDRVLNLINIHSSFIEEMVEDIVSLESFLSSLFITKDQVNPLMKVS